MASRRGHLDSEDLRSVLRHVVVPLVAGAVVAGGQALIASGFSWQTAGSAVGTALLAGVIRFADRFARDTAEPNG